MNPLTWVIAAGLGAAVSSWDSTRLVIPPDGSHLQLLGLPGTEPNLVVRPLNGPALLGRTEVLRDRVIFRPILPFLPGQRYRVEWRNPDGAPNQVEFENPARNRSRPTARLAPEGQLPANALKIYLHFSKPMEQGVFLRCLRLLDGSDKEVTGPFRETELWSPDGKRLTVWFHPGRQKTGVNLNVDEGPVLRQGQRHTLIISGSWRDTSGIALGKDVRLQFTAGHADHQSPALNHLKITPPRAHSRQPLVVNFPEPLDPAMLPNALSVLSDAEGVLTLSVVTGADGKSWSATPPEPWRPGVYKLIADPLLEDLAGNSLGRPFEINLTTDSTPTRPTKVAFALDWEVAP